MLLPHGENVSNRILELVMLLEHPGDERGSN